MSHNFAALKAQGEVLTGLVKTAIDKIATGSDTQNAEIDAMTADLKVSSDNLDAAIKGNPVPVPDPAFSTPESREAARVEARRLASL